MIKASADLATDPLVLPWADNGLPLIRRRASDSEATGVALGLPLPPLAGKRRLCFLMQPDDIVATAPPVSLCAASEFAPRNWLPTLTAVEELASSHGIDVRVFGSLGWQALTGLQYLTDRSDLDLLFNVSRETDLKLLARGLAMIEASAPMRLDGEFVRFDGAAVNWRELHAGAKELLVKTLRGIHLLDSRMFVQGEIVS
jgi:phosphoribosyl-dephospho-CoA transferase